MMIWIICAVVIGIGFVAFTGAPYVPTRPRDIKKVFDELYPLHANDLLVDIGSGDGIVLREAARRGASAVGYEIHPILVVISRWLCRKYPTIRITFTNFWRISLPDETTVVYTFGEARDIERMYEYVHAEATRLARPISFISYAFEIKAIKSTKTIGAHHLYRVEPLQK